MVSPLYATRLANHAQDLDASGHDTRANPMTTQDDIIVGGASGVPARLAKGTDSQVLTVDPTTHHLVWATPSGGSGMTNPMTTAGDLIVGGVAGAPARLAKGSDGYVLAVDPVTHLLAWRGLGGIIDYITGDSSIFTTSNGAWTNTGGTLAWDTTIAVNGEGGYPDFGGSLKFTATATATQHVDYALPGTFLAGHRYDMFAMTQIEETTSSNGKVELTLGLYGTDFAPVVATMNGADYATRWIGLYTTWIPTADRTGVTVRMEVPAGGLSPATMHVHLGFIRVAEITDGGIGLDMVKHPTTPNIMLVNDSFYLGNHQGAFVAYVQDGSLELGTGGASGALGQLYLNATGDTQIFSGYSSSGDLAGGLNIEVGPDFVGLYIGEKSASIVQIYPDTTGYDVELQDRGTKHWYSLSAAGVSKNLTSMESRKGEGTATITAAATSVTVTHGAGYTPAAQDIIVVPTNSPTNDPGWWWIDTIGATTFKINVRAVPGISTATFSWRVDR